MDDSGWGDVSALPTDGWGTDAATLPTDGWGNTAAAAFSASGEDAATATSAAATAPAAAASAAPRPPRPPPRREDDEAAAKLVVGLSAKVLAAKKKIAKVRSEMDGLDSSKTGIQAEIDALMPSLLAQREQKNQAMGQIAGARLPQLWLDRAKELNNRRKQLPGGCKTEAELVRAMKDLEGEMSHGSLTLKQEKAAMEKIRELKRGRQVVAEFERDQAILDGVLEQHKASQTESKAAPPASKDVDALRLSTQEMSATMDRLKAARQEIYDKRGGFNGQLEELRAELDRLFGEVRTHQTDAPKAVAHFFAEVQALDAKLKGEREEKAMTSEQKSEKAAQKAAADAEKAAAAA